MCGLNMLRIFATVLVALVVPSVICGPGSGPAAAQGEVEPVVPFMLFSARWDHHWFAWLP
jgi:hypothetical protein